jgi:predicted transcriptional regulator
LTADGFNHVGPGLCAAEVGRRVGLVKALAAWPTGTRGDDARISIVTDTHLISLTADIVSAHVSHNNVTTADVPGLIESVFGALSKAAEPPVADVPAQEPAVAIRASIKPDYLVCLEDGVKLKMLKRYLRTNYDMTPEEYRTKWKLPRDYPMVAPNYAETRRSLAHQIGLGRKAGDKTSAGALNADGAVKSAGRKRLGIAAAKDAAQQHLGTAPAEAVEN